MSGQKETQPAESSRRVLAVGNFGVNGPSRIQARSGTRLAHPAPLAVPCALMSQRTVRVERQAMARSKSNRAMVQPPDRWLKTKAGIRGCCQHRG